MTLGLLGITATVAVDVLLVKNIPLSDVNFIAHFGGWFLITLFFMQLLISPIITIVKDRRLIAILTLFIYVAFFVTNYTGIQYAQQTLVASVFGMLGYCVRPWLDKLGNNDCKMSVKGFGWMALIVAAILSMYNEPIGMYINQYGNKLLFLLISIIGIYGIYDLSVSFRNTSFLQWCGKKSIIIYVLQLTIIRCVRFMCYSIVPSFDSTHYPFYCILFVFVMIVLIPATWFCNRYLYLAFGKK